MSYKPSKIPKFAPLARAISVAANSRLVDLMDAYAESERAEFVGRIRDQRFASFVVINYPESGTNLSPQWIARKAAKDADPRTMIATEHYVRSIRVFRRLNRGHRGGLWRIGFHPRVQARDLDHKVVPITLDDVASIHENGNKLTPARPHWGPNRNRMIREAPAVRREMSAEILKSVKKAVGNRMAGG